MHVGSGGKENASHVHAHRGRGVVLCWCVAACVMLCRGAGRGNLVVQDVYGRKSEALEMLVMTVKYVEEEVGRHHLLSFLPTLQALRLEAELTDTHECYLKCAAQRAWAATMLLFPRLCRARRDKLLPGASSELDVKKTAAGQWQEMMDLHVALFYGTPDGVATRTTLRHSGHTHDECLILGKAMHANMSYAFTYPNPTEVLLCVVEAITHSKALDAVAQGKAAEASAAVSPSSAVSHAATAAPSQGPGMKDGNAMCYAYAYQLVLAAHHVCVCTCERVCVYTRVTGCVCA
jgi:hypothetical protein